MVSSKDPLSSRAVYVGEYFELLNILIVLYVVCQALVYCVLVLVGRSVVLLYSTGDASMITC